MVLAQARNAQKPMQSLKKGKIYTDPTPSAYVNLKLRSMKSLVPCKSSAPSEELLP